MATYRFGNPENTGAMRIGDDGSIVAIPWSAERNEPLDEGVWQRQWVEDGSPAPEPCDPAVKSFGVA